MAFWPLATRTGLADHDNVHAQIVLFDGYDPLDVIAPFEVLAADSEAVDGQPAESNAHYIRVKQWARASSVSGRRFEFAAVSALLKEQDFGH